MAGLRDLLKGGKDGQAQAAKVASVLAENYPFVAEILGGIPANGSQGEVSPGTITVYILERKARFTANVKSEEKSFIGDIGDLVNLWGSINCVLATGEVSSKRYTDRNGSYTEAQKELLL